MAQHPEELQKTKSNTSKLANESNSINPAAGVLLSNFTSILNRSAPIGVTIHDPNSPDGTTPVQGSPVHKTNSAGAAPAAMHGASAAAAAGAGALARAISDSRVPRSRSSTASTPSFELINPGDIPSNATSPYTTLSSPLHLPAVADALAAGADLALPDTTKTTPSQPGRGISPPNVDPTQAKIIDALRKENEALRNSLANCEKTMRERMEETNELKSLLDQISNEHNAAKKGSNHQNTDDSLPPEIEKERTRLKAESEVAKLKLKYEQDLHEKTKGELARTTEQLTNALKEIESLKKVLAEQSPQEIIALKKVLAEQTSQAIASQKELTHLQQIMANNTSAAYERGYKSGKSDGAKETMDQVRKNQTSFAGL